MPDKILNAGGNYYHAISSKFLNRPLGELLELGGHDRGQGCMASRVVSLQLDRERYAGIEYPSVRLAGASNVVSHYPLSVIDLLQLSDTFHNVFADVIIPV